MKPTEFKSDFLVLDVKEGRQELAARIKRGEQIGLRIHVELDTQWGDDDGTSIEFCGKVLMMMERED